MFDWFIFVGLVGITIVVTMSYTFYKVSEYLGTFTHKLNPLRYVSEFISCPLVFGFAIGFLCIVYDNGDVINGSIYGGVIGLVSFIVYNLLEILKRISGAYDPKKTSMDNTLALIAAKKNAVENKKLLKPKNKRMGLTEQEAFAVLDKQDKEDEFDASF